MFLYYMMQKSYMILLKYFSICFLCYFYVIIFFNLVKQRVIFVSELTKSFHTGKTSFAESLKRKRHRKHENRFGYSIFESRITSSIASPDQSGCKIDGNCF